MTANNRAMLLVTSTSKDRNSIVLRMVLLVMICPVLMSNTGCVGFLANMIRVVKGTDAPAEFDDLKDKKVAVIASTESGLNADATGIIVSNYVHALLATNVKKIQMVNQEEVGRIINDMPIGEQQMATIGSRLNADYVVSVDVQNLKLHEGKTLYKGRSSTTLTVYKVGEGSSPVFRKLLPEFVYPQTGVPITDVDEATFRQFYLAEISQRVARVFYPFDPTVDVAKDAAVASLNNKF
jgi:hypothetical protein